MTRARLSNVVILLCGLLVGFTLLINIPSADSLNHYGGQAVLWIVLVSFTLVFGVLLTEGEFSAVHIIGITAFLTIPKMAQPLLLWAVTIGGLIGGMILARRHDATLRRRLTIRSAGGIVLICARLTLSLFAAGTLYDLVGGTRPLLPPVNDKLIPLAAFAVLYTGLYLVIFFLEAYIEYRSIRRLVRENWLLLSAMLVIPLPFGILSAIVISLTPSSLYVFSVGVLLAAVGLYRFSRARHQLQKQLDEQQSLTAVSQALQSDLKLESLLYAIYNQVLQLLHPNLFVAALYERSAHQLRFPLVMQNGQAVTDYQEDTNKSFLGRVLRQQLPMLVNRAMEDKADIHSWLGVPLIAGGRLLGGIAVRSDDPLRLFSDDDKRLLTIVATSASVAIENAQLYEQQFRRATRMTALTRTLPLLSGTLSIETVQETIVAAANDMMQSDGVALYLRGEDEKLAMQLVASTGLTQANETLTPDDVVKREGKTNYLGLDLVVNNERLGGLAFFFNKERPYDEEDMPVALTFASQAAQAIYNAQKYTITDRALEQQIHRVTETRDRLQVILDTMTEGIVMIDCDGVVAMANPRVDLLGLPADELLGQKIDLLLEKPGLELAQRMGFESDQKVRDLIKTLLAPNNWKSDSLSYSITDDGEEHFIERNSILVQGAGGETLGMMLVFSDETEARELMQMRADLSNMIVHDLRSPLTAVTTGLKLLRDIVPQDSSLRPLVVSTTETSQRAIRKMLVRVDSLLDISRLDSGVLSLETAPTDMATLADGICIELSPLAQELEVTLTTDIGEETPALDADADKVERVLQNLVDNALKFCPAGGRVMIRSHQPVKDAQGERFVRIDVMDSGPGIPDEYKTKLFDRYAQIKGRRGKRRGSGLGLTFCRLVVEAHGGRIWIEDNPGGGSIFAFTLPVAEANEVDKAG